LEALVREGAQRLLAAALEDEVQTFLGRRRYERGQPFRGYRNGYHAERELTVGVGKVAVRVPRVSDVPEEASADGFQSRIVGKYQRASVATQQLFVRLYLEGLATGDFEPVFRELVGETTALSASTVVRLKAQWAEDYTAWQQRRLDDHRYAYVWADGIYLGAGQEDEKSVVLCLVGAREDGEKELLALTLGYRESAASWADLLRDLRVRGLAAPLVAIGDGALGLWAALDQVFPTTQHQRCWNHRVLNVQDKLPKRLHAEARRRLRAIAEAVTQAEGEQLRDVYVAELREGGQDQAADCILRDWEDFVRVYQFPKEHWLHLRTSNPIESIFAGVRLRTNAAKRLRSRENVLYLVFKLIERLSMNWRALNGGETLMRLVLDGAEFRDGRHQPRPLAAPDAVAA
jgi:transposase-like protein